MRSLRAVVSCLVLSVSCSEFTGSGDDDDDGAKRTPGTSSGGDSGTTTTPADGGTADSSTQTDADSVQDGAPQPAQGPLLMLLGGAAQVDGGALEETATVAILDEDNPNVGWHLTTSLPAPAQYPAGFAADGRVYAMAANTDKVYSTQVVAGEAQAWVNESLPRVTGRCELGSLQPGNLFLLCNDGSGDVAFTRDANGTWTDTGFALTSTQSGYLGFTGTSFVGLRFAGGTGYVFSIGGAAEPVDAPSPLGTANSCDTAGSKRLYRVRTDAHSAPYADTDLARFTWDTDPIVPGSDMRQVPACVATEKWLYVAGGADDSGALDDVYRAPILQDGRIGAWNLLPALRVPIFGGRLVAVPR